MKKSPKKCLFPLEKAMKSASEARKPQLSYPTANPLVSNPTSNLGHSEIMSYKTSSVPLDNKTCQSIAKFCLTSHPKDTASYNSNVPQQSKTDTSNENCRPSNSNKCPYKKLGVKKNLLLRSGLASLPACTELRSSPKRVPLSPLKSVGQAVSTSASGNECNKRQHLPPRVPFNLKLSTSENLDSEIKNENMPGRDVLTSLAIDRVTLECEKPSSPPPTAPRYSPISTASESSSVSDVTDSSSAPSFTDDVTHYAIRASSSDVVGTKLTLIRQSKPGSSSNSNMNSSNRQQERLPTPHSTENPDCQDVPVDMTLKKLPDAEGHTKCPVSASELSSLQKPQREMTSLYKNILSKQTHQILRSNSPNLKYTCIRPPTPSKQCYGGKENIPPLGGGEILSRFTHLRTFTPEPTVPQRFHRKRQNIRNLDNAHSSPRPSTAPPTVEFHHSDTALDLSHGIASRNSKDGWNFVKKHSEGIKAEAEDGDNQSCRDLSKMCKKSSLNNDCELSDRHAKIVTRESRLGEKELTQREDGPHSLWSHHAAPPGPIPTFAPPAHSTHLPANYISLAPDTASRLYGEYAYHGLQRPLYDSSLHRERMGYPHPPQLMQGQAQAFAHRAVLNNDHACGFQFNNGFPESQEFNLSVQPPLAIKEERGFRETIAPDNSEYGSRMPPAHSSDPLLTAHVKTELYLPETNIEASDSASAQHDIRPASVLVDVVGMDDSREETGQGPKEFTNKTNHSEDGNKKAEIDSGLAPDLSCNTSDTKHDHLSRSDVITPPAGTEGQGGKTKTPDGTTIDSGIFVTPTQYPQGKGLFPDPVGASTPMEEESLWRPWNKAANNLKRFHCTEQAASSDSEASLPSTEKQQKISDDSLKCSQPRAVALTQESDKTRFISPVLPPRSERRKTLSPKRRAQKCSHSFSISSMLSSDTNTETRVPHSHQPSDESPLATHPRYTSIQSYHSLHPQPYIRPPATINGGATESPMNLSCNPSLPIMTPSIPDNFPYRAAPDMKLFQTSHLMLHGQGHIHHKQAASATFIPPHAMLPPLAASFGADGIPHSTQLHHLPGYTSSQPVYLGPITTSTSFATLPIRQSTAENEALDLSDSTRYSTRSAHHHNHHHPVASASSSSSPDDDFSSSHSHDHLTSQRSPSPALQPVDRPIVQPANSQPIPGVVLSSPPPGARPASAFVQTKKLIPKRVLLEAKRKQAKADAGQAKKRDRPPQFGEDDIAIFEVRFFDSPERSRFCNENHEFVVPKVPDSREDQDELRDALGRLFQRSNLPKVPNALLYNVHALAYYPFMQHLFHLYLEKGINIYEFKFGAYGQAFENPRLRDLGETEFNNRLDSMCYVASDNLLHCLVMRHIDNGARCDHVASELGKMRRHAKNHYPEKKWVCCFCRAQMPDLTDMERHTSTHTSLKPFRCVDCNKFFSQKVTLANHMNQHHQKELEKMDPKKSFTCRQDGCLFQDHQREACIEHLENHHRDDEYVRRSRRGMWPFPPKSKSAARGVAGTVGSMEFLPAIGPGLNYTGADGLPTCSTPVQTCSVE